MPSTICFGDAVQERAEGERGPGLRGLRRSGGRTCALRLAEAFDGAVGQVVGECPSGEPERNGVAAAELDAFLGEVEN
jgi:hypothetical protein